MRGKVAKSLRRKARAEATRLNQLQSQISPIQKIAHRIFLSKDKQSKSFLERSAYIGEFKYTDGYKRIYGDMKHDYKSRASAARS